MKDAKKRTSKKVSIKYDDYEMNSELEVLGKDKKYLILTYGCQMNEHDSENIEALLIRLGFSKVDIPILLLITS